MTTSTPQRGYIAVNLPDTFTNLSKITNIREAIDDFLNSKSIHVYKRIDNYVGMVTTSPPTISPGPITTEPNDYIIEEEEEPVIGVSTTTQAPFQTGIFGSLTPSSLISMFKSLTIDELVTILVLLLNIDLDRDGTPDVFQLIKSIKDYIIGSPDNNINTDDDLNTQINSNVMNNANNILSENTQSVLNDNADLFSGSPELSNYLFSNSNMGQQQYRHYQRYQKYREWLKQQQNRKTIGDQRIHDLQQKAMSNAADSDIYKNELDKLRAELLKQQQTIHETSFNSDFTPGYAYTNPKFWESEKAPPPVCIADKYSIKSPALVMWDGLASNALNIQKNLLPEFSYSEKHAQQQAIDSFEDNKQRHCKNYCSDNCNHEMCYALDCPNCQR
jgi:hypothetical protein